MKTVLLAFSLVSPLIALAQTRPPDVPPAPDTGFFVRFEADGKKFEKKLYGYGGTYDHVILRSSPDDTDGNSVPELDLEVASLKGDANPQSVRVWIHDKVIVKSGASQTFTLSGPSFCTGMDGQLDHVQGEGFFTKPAPGNTKPFNFTNYSPRKVMYEGNREEDEKNTGSIGFQTQHKGVKGNFEGMLTITRIDTAQQVIEGRFEFDAARMINTRRLPTGEWEGRCFEPSDFRLDTVKVSRGEFRMNYCFSPPRPGNSRYCPQN